MNVGDQCCTKPMHRTTVRLRGSRLALDRLALSVGQPPYGDGPEQVGAAALLPVLPHGISARDSAHFRADPRFARGHTL